LPGWRETVRRLGRRGGSLLGAAALLGATLVLAFTLATYHTSDPAMNTAAGGPARNMFGSAGAWAADLLLSLFGPPVVLLLPLALLIGLRLWRGAGAGNWLRSLLVASPCFATARSPGCPPALAAHSD
jgi:S-DNA-T family DNA segregation ATPase FtsK/SpoIIIE